MALSLEQYADEYDKNPTIKHILTKRIERQRKKALGFSIKNGNQIPENLIIEILSRLPVKALLQFKSACKLWYDIIKSSYFISKQLRNYYDNNNNWRDCRIVQYFGRSTSELNVYELLIDDTRNRILSYQGIESPMNNTHMYGPCDGIYLLWYFDSFDDVLVPSNCGLWNPALNEFKMLPEIISCWKRDLEPHSITLSESYGFGYDSNTDDYKVILILSYGDAQDHDIRMSILIYSLRTNSWRYWGDIDNSLVSQWTNTSYAFVNGSYYWVSKRLVTDSWNEMIFSFDISAETYHEIPLPQSESEPNYCHLIVYQDSIGLAFVPDDDNTRFCIWTRNNEVWTQILNMKLDFQVRGLFSQWSDNKLVIRRASPKLVLFDTNAKEIFELDDPQEHGCENICVYKESLVSIKDFGT